MRAVCNFGLSLAALISSQLVLADTTTSIRVARTEAEAADLVQNMECTEASQRGNNLTEAEALTIARNAVVANDTPNNAKPIVDGTFRTKRDECGWDVLLVRQSPGPGDHRFIRINAQGKVLTYVRGL